MFRTRHNVFRRLCVWWRDSLDARQPSFPNYQRASSLTTLTVPHNSGTLNLLFVKVEQRSISASETVGQPELQGNRPLSRLPPPVAADVRRRIPGTKWRIHHKSSLPGFQPGGFAFAPNFSQIAHRRLFHFLGRYPVFFKKLSVCRQKNARRHLERRRKSPCNARFSPARARPCSPALTDLCDGDSYSHIVTRCATRIKCFHAIFVMGP
jgi:hypothetical protein